MYGTSPEFHKKYSPLLCKLRNLKAFEFCKGIWGLNLTYIRYSYELWLVFSWSSPTTQVSSLLSLPLSPGLSTSLPLSILSKSHPHCLCSILHRLDHPNRLVSSTFVSSDTTGGPRLHTTKHGVVQAASSSPSEPQSTITATNPRYHYTSACFSFSFRNISIEQTLVSCFAEFKLKRRKRKNWIVLAVCAALC